MQIEQIPDRDDLIKAFQETLMSGKILGNVQEGNWEIVVDGFNTSKQIQENSNTHASVYYQGEPYCQLDADKKGFFVSASLNGETAYTREALVASLIFSEVGERANVTNQHIPHVMNSALKFTPQEEIADLSTAKGYSFKGGQHHGEILLDGEPVCDVIDSGRYLKGANALKVQNGITIVPKSPATEELTRAIALTSQDIYEAYLFNRAKLTQTKAPFSMPSLTIQGQEITKPLFQTGDSMHFPQSDMTLDFQQLREITASHQNTVIRYQPLENGDFSKVYIQQSQVSHLDISASQAQKEIQSLMYHQGVNMTAIDRDGSRNDVSPAQKVSRFIDGLNRNGTSRGILYALAMEQTAKVENTLLRVSQNENGNFSLSVEDISSPNHPRQMAHMEFSKDSTGVHVENIAFSHSHLHPDRDRHIANALADTVTVLNRYVYQVETPALEIKQDSPKKPKQQGIEH